MLTRTKIVKNCEKKVKKCGSLTDQTGHFFYKIEKDNLDRPLQ